MQLPAVEEPHLFLDISSITAWKPCLFYHFLLNCLSTVLSAFSWHFWCCLLWSFFTANLLLTYADHSSFQTVVSNPCHSPALVTAHSLQPACTLPAITTLHSLYPLLDLCKFLKASAMSIKSHGLQILGNKAKTTFCMCIKQACRQSTAISHWKCVKQF